MQPTKTKAAEPSAVKCRILHVNDTDADHEVLTKLLAPDESFSVERARSGVEGLQKLHHKAQVPNLVLVTWSFAQMACAEFIDQMKADKRLSVIPIVVMAPAMSRDEVMQAYDVGAACAYYNKDGILTLSSEAFRLSKISGPSFCCHIAIRQPTPCRNSARLPS